jgi:outer membrane lipoprotein-sorting protein
MKSLLKKVTLVFAGALLITLVSACSDGPAEDAGEELDRIVKDAENAVENACEEVKEDVEAEDEDC